MERKTGLSDATLRGSVFAWDRSWKCRFRALAGMIVVATEMVIGDARETWFRSVGAR